jgi:hypothetical protein
MHRPPDPVDRLDGRRDLALERPGEPGAEEGVDDQARAAHVHRGDRLDRARPTGGGERRVAREPPAVAQEVEAHREAGVRQDPCRDEAVPAVVARPAGHDDGPAPPQAERGVGHARAGSFHQRDPRHAGRDRLAVGFAHPCGGQEEGHGHVAGSGNIGIGAPRGVPPAGVVICL